MEATNNQAVGDGDFSLDAIDIISPDRYQKNGYPHAEWTYLRKHKPVFKVERPDVDPFWVTTRAGDITEISRQPRLWLNRPRLGAFVREEGDSEVPQDTFAFRNLLNMDPPQHGEYRAILNRYFTPRSIRELAAEIYEITDLVLDDAMDKRACDFVTDISARIPVA